MFPPIGARAVFIFSFGMVWDFKKGLHQIYICDLEQTCQCDQERFIFRFNPRCAKSPPLYPDQIPE
jgi:hypothetical protein